MKRLFALLGILAALLVAPAVAAGGNAGVARVDCVLGDVGCTFHSPTVGTMIACTPWDAVRPVTCSLDPNNTFAGAVPRTTVYTQVFCRFFWPLLPPVFPFPPGFTFTVWSTDRGTAIVRPDGSVTVHCPPAV